MFCNTFELDFTFFGGFGFWKDFSRVLCIFFLEVL